MPTPENKRLTVRIAGPKNTDVHRYYIVSFTPEQSDIITIRFKPKSHIETKPNCRIYIKKKTDKEEICFPIHEDDDGVNDDAIKYLIEHNFIDISKHVCANELRAFLKPRLNKPQQDCPFE